MKISIRSFVAGMVAFAVTAGAAPEKRYAARLTVKGELEKDRDSSKSESSKGSTKTNSEIQFYELEVTVANTGKHEGTFDLEWYFLKRRLDAKGKKGDPVLSEKDKTILTIPGMKRVVHPVSSGALSWTESKSSKSSSGKSSKSSSSSKKNISGDVYGGYVMLLRAEGQIVAKYSSDKKFLSDEWLTKLQAPVKKPTVVRKTNKKKRPKKKK